MSSPNLRVLHLSGDPAALGGAHGSAYSSEIRLYARERIRLSGEGTDLSEERLLDLAERCLPAHRHYAPDLYEEMDALADSAGISPAEVLIAGGFTDFVDTVRGEAGSAPVSDNCTAVVVPDGVAGGAGFLAQTWDMHASATPHVLMLSLRPDSGPAALVYSTVGCLGQMGMNEAGIAVGINNLAAADGRVGVTWPFVIRKVLQQTSLDAAISSVLEADLAGGHNYVLFDREGRGVGIEAMPTAHHVTRLEDRPLVHTNHCLAPRTRAVEASRPEHLAASSRTRLEDAATLLERRPVDEEGLMALFRDESSICRHPVEPENYQTCGAVIMRPRTGDMWACWGIPSENDFEHLQLEGIRA